MPTYEYECPDHGITERYGSITEDQPKEIECHECAGKASRILSVPSVQVFQPYFSEHIKPGGAMLTSQSQKRRLLKEQGLREVGNDHPMVDKSRSAPPKIYSMPGVAPGQSRVSPRE